MAKKKVDLSPCNKLYKITIGAVHLTEEGNWDGEVGNYSSEKVVAKTAVDAIAKVKIKDTKSSLFHIESVEFVSCIDKL